jgi:hypothetical protein
MGGTLALQIDLGNRGGIDDPHDTAGIDPDDTTGPHWWLDIEGGQRTLVSDLGLDVAPAAIAEWIATTARAEQCPAAVDELEPLVERIRDAGYETVADVVQYEDMWLLCYVRGPEGIIVELGERLDE